MKIGIRLPNQVRVVRETVKAFADIGADELILNPTTDDIQRLAGIVL